MPFPVVATFATVGLSLLNYLLRPRPEVEKGRKRADSDVEGSPVPIAYGRVRIDNAAPLWFGDLTADRRNNPGRIDYSLGFQLGICLQSPNASAGASLVRVWVDDREWYAPMSALAHDEDGAVVALDRFDDDPSGSVYEDFLGGVGAGGGFWCSFRWWGGTFTQNHSTYRELQGVVAKDRTGYPGLCHVVFEGVGDGERTDSSIGESPNLHPMAFEIEIQPDALGAGAIGSDANPAEVLWDLLTGDWGRIGLPTDLLDQSSFTTVAATLASESHGIILATDGQTDAVELIGEVLRQINGLLYEEPTTRQITLALVRDDYTVGNLDVYDEDDIIEVVAFNVSQLSETVNSVRVTYTNRNDAYSQRTVTAQDDGNVAEQGRIQTAEITFAGCSNKALANQLAARELNQLSRPLVQLSILTTRRGATLRPGDVIVVAWAEYGITQLVCRVLAIDLGTLGDGRVKIDLVEDVFATDWTVYGAEDPDALPSRPTAAAVTTQDIRELPRFWMLKAYALQLVGDPDQAVLNYLAAAPDNSHLAFAPQISEDTGSTWSADGSVQRGFAPVAQLNAAYPIDTDEIDTSNTLVLKNISDPAVFVSTVEASIRANGANLIQIGDELLAFLTATVSGAGSLVTLHTVWRGLLDTSPRAHAVNATVWLWFAAEIDASVGGLATMGSRAWLSSEQDLQARLITWTTGLSALDPASALVDTDVDIADRATLPYPPDQVTINGRAAHTTGYFETEDIATTTTSLTVAWVKRDRQATAIARPDDVAETLSDDSTDTNATRYIARHRFNAGSWTETTFASPATSGTFSATEDDAVELELYAERDNDSTLRSLYPATRSFDLVMTNRLDNLPGLTLTGAWGVRTMVDGYAGALVRVRDTNDDSEADISAGTTGHMNQASVVGQARVVKVYDQSGNGNDLVQTTHAAQPLLVQVLDGSVYDSVIDFDGTDDVLETADGTVVGGFELLTEDVVVMWSGTHDAVGTNIGMVFGLVDQTTSAIEYGVTLGSGFTTLYVDGTSTRWTSTTDPANTNDEWSMIAAIGSDAAQLWQETAAGLQIDGAGATIGYSANNYRLSLGLHPSVSGGYAAMGLHELAIFSGAANLDAEQRDAVFDLHTTWWR